MMNRARDKEIAHKPISTYSNAYITEIANFSEQLRNLKKLNEKSYPFNSLQYENKKTKTIGSKKNWSHTEMIPGAKK